MAAASWKGQLEAMGREARKDINEKVHEVFFSQGAGQHEIGTPLVPTQMMVNEELGTGKGDNFDQVLDSYANRGNIHGQEQGKEQDRGIDR